MRPDEPRHRLVRGIDAGRLPRRRALLVHAVAVIVVGRACFLLEGTHFLRGAVFVFGLVVVGFVLLGLTSPSPVYIWKFKESEYKWVRCTIIIVKKESGLQQ